MVQPKPDYASRLHHGVKAVGEDFDQVFAHTLRTSSVRALFAYAARFGCKVRSVDWVAAYLQGELLEGEGVYCHMPIGYIQTDQNGRPYILKIVKSTT